MAGKIDDESLEKALELYDSKDFEASIQIFKSLAESGNAFAQYMFGTSYFYGNGVELNKEMSFFWISEAVLQNFVGAQAMAGVMLIRGEGVEKNIRDGIDLLSKAADQDDIYSCTVLAEIYSGHYGNNLVEIDQIKEIKYLEKGARLNDPKCMQRLAYFLSDGVEGVPADQERSLNLNLKAAELGNIEAAYNAGLALSKGRGTEVNPQEAMRWFKIAAVSGSAIAQHNLAALYMNSHDSKDTLEAHYWYLKSAEQGSYLSQKNLGRMYELGEGIDKDLVKALSWNILASQEGKYIEADFQIKRIKEQLSSFEISEAEKIAEEFKSKINKSPLFDEGYFSKLVSDGVRAFQEGYYARALSILFDSAQRGNAIACRYVGIIYFHGLDVQQDYTTALKYFDIASYQGDLISQYKIAEIYQYGYGVDINPEIAFKYFKMAADYEVHLAQYWVALKLQHGDGVEKNLNESIKWYQSAAEMGNLESQLALAEIYIFGFDEIEKNYQEAAFWFTKAAEKGHPQALNDLGNMYNFGMHFEKDRMKALDLYRQAAEAGGDAGKYNYGSELIQSNDVIIRNKGLELITSAADNGYIKAQLNLGQIYLGAYNLEVDYQKSFNYFRAAAEQGDLEGLTSLGVSYARGYGCEKNQEKANELYKMAADQGDAQAQFNLGWNYHYGSGVEKDLDEAIKYYSLAADQKHPAGLRGLGELYEIASDESSEYLDMAVNLYHQAAELGDLVAEYNLGVFYEYGTGVDIDLQTSAMYLERAATKDHPSANLNLGLLYQRGFNGEPDYIKAMHYFVRAMELGNAKAEGCIGFLYQHGLGVEQNTLKAIEFFEICAKRGQVHCQYNLGLLLDDSYDSQKKAFEWFEKAALQELPEAQIDLSIMLFYGKGATQDLVEAVKWALIAKTYEEGRAENLINYYQQEISQDILDEGFKKAEAYLEIKN